MDALEAQETLTIDSQILERLNQIQEEIKSLKAELANKPNRNEVYTIQESDERLTAIRLSTDMKIGKTEEAMTNAVAELNLLFKQFKDAQTLTNRAQDDNLQKMASSIGHIANAIQQINQTLTNISAMQNTVQQQIGQVQKDVQGIEKKAEAHDQQLFDINERGGALARGLQKKDEDIAALRQEQIASKNAHIEDVKSIYLKVNALDDKFTPTIAYIERQNQRRQMWITAWRLSQRYALTPYGKLIGGIVLGVFGVEIQVPEFIEKLGSFVEAVIHLIFGG